MPSKTAEALSWLGVEKAVGVGIDADPIHAGAAVEAGRVLFPKVRLDETTQETPAPPKAGAPKKKEAKMADEISFEEFMKVDLRTARILEAERVGGTDKLVHLKIDIGGEQRDLVAGIAQQYAPEDLIGRTIVVVANLAPRKLRGITSKGMLLAAVDGDTLRLLQPDGDIPSGTKVS
jgi:methionyl-tRNA synthetase